MVRTDVLIVGAGPAGLVLAAVLADHAVDLRIVDRKAGPVTQSRAAIVHVRTLELLHRLGLADRAVARGVKTTRVEIYERGRPAGEFPLAGRGSEALTPFPYALGLEQDRTEQLLVEWLAERGHGVDWHTELVTLNGGPDGARAVVCRTDGTKETISARWVVGADGARSPVRHALGVGFAGSTYDQTCLLADVDIDHRSGADLRAGTLRLNLTRGGFVGIFRLASGRYRLFGAVPPNLTPANASDDVSHEAYAEVPLADIQRWFDEYFAINASLTGAAWTALFRIHSRIADRFRAGGVFRLFSQTWISYRHSTAIACEPDSNRRPHPGDRAPYGHFEFTQDGAPGSLFDVIGGTRHHVLLFQGSKPDSTILARRRLIEDLLGQYAVDIRVHLVAASERTLHSRYGGRKPRLCLIRPDGHLAYTGSPDGLSRFGGFLDQLYVRHTTTGGRQTEPGQQHR